MMAQLEKTTVINPFVYVDLWIINNESKTFVMEKIEEPNVFGVKELHDGDVFDKVVQRLNAPAAGTA